MFAFFLACAIDSYKLGNGNYQCDSCPANSHTDNKNGRAWCDCKNGFYRATWEREDVNCTGEYSDTFRH